MTVPRLIVNDAPAERVAIIWVGSTVVPVLQVTLSLAPRLSSYTTKIKLLAVTAVVLIWQVAVLAAVAQENEPDAAEPHDATEGEADVPTPAQLVAVLNVAPCTLPVMVTDVPVAAPSTGVIRVGVPSNTRLPVPVAPVLVTPSIV